MIRENHRETDSVSFGAAIRLALALIIVSASSMAQAATAEKAGEAPGSAEPGFAPIYALLQTHCGACHVQGVADGPWSLNTPPSTDRFPECLAEQQSAALQCATYHELVASPGPGIPAWVRPEDGSASEPYAQACDTELSFHIGHSLPQRLPDEDCARFLRRIEVGAPR